MKTLLGMVLIAIPMAMAALGDFSAGMIAFAALGALGCWLLSAWFSE